MASLRFIISSPDSSISFFISSISILKLSNILINSFFLSFFESSFKNSRAKSILAFLFKRESISEIDFSFISFLFIPYFLHIFSIALSRASWGSFMRDLISPNMSSSERSPAQERRISSPMRAKSIMRNGMESLLKSFGCVSWWMVAVNKSMRSPSKVCNRSTAISIALFSLYLGKINTAKTS